MLQIALVLVLAEEQIKGTKSVRAPRSVVRENPKNTVVLKNNHFIICKNII
jgi:hypothetical protein